MFNMLSNNEDTAQSTAVNGNGHGSVRYDHHQAPPQPQQQEGGHEGNVSPNGPSSLRSPRFSFSLQKNANADDTTSRSFANDTTTVSASSNNGGGNNKASRPKRIQTLHKSVWIGRICFVSCLIVVALAFVYGLKFIRQFALQIAQENHDAVMAMDQEEVRAMRYFC